MHRVRGAATRNFRGGTVVGLSNVDGYSASENATTQTITFESNRWYHLTLRVTDERIEAFIDGQKVIDQQRGGHTFGIWLEVEPCRPFGVATWRTGGALRDIILRRVDADLPSYRDTLPADVPEERAVPVPESVLVHEDTGDHHIVLQGNGNHLINRPVDLAAGIDFSVQDDQNVDVGTRFGVAAGHRHCLPEAFHEQEPASSAMCVRTLTLFAASSGTLLYRFHSEEGRIDSRFWGKNGF